MRWLERRSARIGCGSLTSPVWARARVPGLASISIQTEDDIVKTIANTHRLRVNPGAWVSPLPIARDSASAPSQPVSPASAEAPHDRDTPSSRPASHAMTRMASSEITRFQPSSTSMPPPPLERRGRGPACYVVPASYAPARQRSTAMLGYVTDPSAPDGLIRRELPEPQPGEHDAVLDVSAYAVNRGELSLLTQRPDGFTPGQDVAGVVRAAARDGSGPAAGTRVVGVADRGGWSQRVSVPSH